MTASPATVPTTRRVRLTVAYDGAGYHGFVAQPELETVGGTLARSLARVLQTPHIELTCAGRTDAGVHGWGQVVTFDVPVDRLDRLERLARRSRRTRSLDVGPIDEIIKAVNKACGPALVVRDAATVTDDFDARSSARARQYRYTILNRPVADPFLAATAWHVRTPLDVRAMTLACDPLIGRHDFSSFCRRPKTVSGEPASLTRRVFDARWDDEGDGLLHFWIEANAFCHQMVRSIVGTLVEVGRGKKRAGDVMGIMRAADRRAAGDLAPPHGLCLWSVRYADQHADQHADHHDIPRPTATSEGGAVAVAVPSPRRAGAAAG